MGANRLRVDPLLPEDLPTVVDYSAISEKGSQRPVNEDHYLVARLSRRLETLATNISPTFLTPCLEQSVYAMVVADGLGGQGTGELASKEAISLLKQLVEETPDWIMGLERDQCEQILQRLKVRFCDIHSRFNSYADQDPSCAQMCTTLTAAVILGQRMIVAHTGDSRTYLFRNRKLVQVTKDQNVFQALVDKGVSQNEAAHHVSRDVLTGGLYSQNIVEVEVDIYQLYEGDQILICSDGLTDYVTDVEIQGILELDRSASEAVRALVQFARQVGSVDDVTVILSKYRV